MSKRSTSIIIRTRIAGENTISLRYSLLPDKGGYFFVINGQTKWFEGERIFNIIPEGLTIKEQEKFLLNDPFTREVEAQLKQVVLNNPVWAAMFPLKTAEIKITNQKEEEMPKHPETNPCIGCESPKECCTLPIAGEINNNKEEEKEMTTTTTVPSSDIRIKGSFTTPCTHCKKWHLNANDARICKGIAPRAYNSKSFVNNVVIDDVLVGHSHWFELKADASAFATANGIPTFKPANNGHGFKVFVPTAS